MQQKKSTKQHYNFPKNISLTRNPGDGHDFYTFSFLFSQKLDASFVLAVIVRIIQQRRVMHSRTTAVAASVVAVRSVVSGRRQGDGHDGGGGVGESGRSVGCERGHIQKNRSGSRKNIVRKNKLTVVN